MAGLISHLDLFLVFRRFGKSGNFKHLYDEIISKIQFEISDSDRDQIMKFCKNFVREIDRRWVEAHRTIKTFMHQEKNRNWLDKEIKWPACDTVDLTVVMGLSEGLPKRPEFVLTQDLNLPVCTAEAGTSTGNQTRKPFTDLGDKQKKRRSGSIIDDTSEEELEYYFTSKLKANGKLALANIVEHLSKNPDVIPDVTKLLFQKEKVAKISEDNTLALYTSLQLTKWHYYILRAFFNEENNSAALPCYQKLGEAKKRCYPFLQFLEASERGARIRLQGLVNHTVERILLYLGTLSSSSTQGLKLIWKWGIDGSSSQSNYKQKFSDPEYDDSSIVMTSACPLRLVDGEVVIWENPSPCSTDYCRPVKFTFTSESAEFVKAEISDMQREIAELMPTKCGDAEITHELHMTMIDGKVANIIAGVPSSSTCPICLAKPSEMNKLEVLATKTPRQDQYQYGISSLHMKINCMQCLLHISYNMDFKRWCARGADNKALKQARKSEIQQEFREDTGMLIDVVKQSFGTTNDGNTARRFFQDYKNSARITGIDENLIFRFSVILQAISSGININIDKFRSYCQETAELYVHLYECYNMPVSVHKLLIHGADICNNFSVLPIGYLSEEASEARNKDFRNVRERNTRKTGREETNIDIIHGLLISSDPYISLIKPKFSKKMHRELHQEASELLQYNFDGTDFEEEENIVMDCENIPDPLL